MKSIMKKGYFFILDAFIATSIIVLSLVLIFSFHSSKPYQMQGIFLAQDTMDLLFKTKVYEIQNDFVINLTQEGNITNTANSLLEQTAEFFITNRTKLAQDFVLNVTQNMVPEKYGFELKIYNGTSLFNLTINPGLSLQNKSNLLLISKEIISGMLDNYTMWGPMTAEVRVWQ